MWIQPHKFRSALNHWGIFGLVFLIILFIICLVIYPQQSYEASVEGLKLWWEIVLPASLPFFIGSQLLIGLGAVHFLSVILSPIMRPLFNVPGAGAFALAMGISSGNPLGGVVTAELRKKNLCSKTEGERLLSFTNNANLLFMSGAVAVGIFKQPELGIIFAIIHYSATLGTAFIYKFYKFRNHGSTNSETNEEGYLLKAVKSLQKARKDDGRAFGKLLGDAVNKSLSTLLMIGGFIVLFSVLIRILSISGLMNILAELLSPLLTTLGFDKELAKPIISSFFEITNGIKLISLSTAPLEQQILVTCAVISWSGLSIQSQVASVIADTDLSIIPYLFSRIIHAFLSFLFSYIIIKYTNLLNHLKSVSPVFAEGAKSIITSNWLSNFWFGFNQLTVILVFLFLLAVLSASIITCKNLFLNIKKSNR
ncbi:MAG TPA: sporulation integral membrane protein YlbJ [Clostridia bacterium]|nr:sporulation integral membrane protein YlbJ [Clostridia bacterium]